MFGDQLYCNLISLQNNVKEQALSPNNWYIVFYCEWFFPIMQKKDLHVTLDWNIYL